MELPRIFKSRLVNLVNEIQSVHSFSSMKELCEALEDTDWAININVNAEIIGKLIKHHNIETHFGSKPVVNEKVVSSLPQRKKAAMQAAKTKAGRGQKVCPKCQTLNGVRARNCKSCNNLFDGFSPKPPGPPSSPPSGKKAGRGQKVCPKCQTLNGVRARNCKSCNNLFDGFSPKPPAPPKPTTLSGAGRGRKLCPACNEYVGVRTKECSCGHTFETKSVSSEKTSLSSSGPKITFSRTVEEKTSAMDSRSNASLLLPGEISYDAQSLIIHTPSGTCPFKLKEYSLEAVEEWSRNVLEHGAGNKRAYTLDALKYYSRQFFPLMSDEAKEVHKHLYALYGK